MNSAAKTKKKVKNRLKSNIIKGTLILSCASILSRIIGFIYRIYLADILGEQLLGTYQLIFPIYVLCFTIYGAGMQSAISQVVATLMGINNTHPQDSNFKDNTSKYSSSSSAVSKNNNNSSLVKGNYPFVSASARNITPRTILLAGTILSFILALFLSIFINFNSKWIACNILMVPDCDIYLKLLTYLFPFCSISACICGYQYGLENAKPPAIAGIIEQITRILFVFIVQGFFEMFEVLLSYFSNTLSFVRIGAYAVSHAAMMQVVLMLAGAENGSPNWVVIVLGNIFVCGLEGLIVGIQVLRLEYYEMFSRFYKGSGRKFEPFRSDAEAK